MKQKVNDELKKHFRPEFLNRIDDIIVFHQLTRDEIIQMVDLMIGRVEKQLKGKDMAMELTDKAKSLLAKRGFDPVLGARPLRRTIQREIEDAAVREDPVRRGRSRPARHGRRRQLGRRRRRRGRGVHVHRVQEAGQAGRRAGSGAGRSRGHAERGHGHRITNRSKRAVPSRVPPVRIDTRSSIPRPVRT